MSDQCDFPDFKEFVTGESALLKNAFGDKYGLVDSVEEAGMAAGFAVLWPGITGMNKLFGQYHSKGDAPSHLDMNAHPVRGIDSPLK